MVPKTSFPHTNLVILVFRVYEFRVPSFTLARRALTGCVYTENAYLCRCDAEKHFFLARGRRAVVFTRSPASPLFQ